MNILIRYIVEKYIDNGFGYGHGYAILMDGDKPRTFVNDRAAFNWLVENDPEFAILSVKYLSLYYNIKEHVI